MNRFDNIHLGLSQEDALRILRLRPEDLEAASDYYMAASHLINFPGNTSVVALMEFINQSSQEQSVRLAQRKAVEVLGRLGATEAIASIGTCLQSDDPYLVENSAWALRELNCTDQSLHQMMVQHLDNPIQNRRVLIQSLAGLGVDSAVKAIAALESDEKPGVRGAALCAVARMTGCREHLHRLENHLTLPNQMDRQSAIQDIIDADAGFLLPSVLKTPVSPVFRMRALKELWPQNKMQFEGLDLTTSLDGLMLDEPGDLVLVHRYDEEQLDTFLIQEFFGTDFSRSYLALQTLGERPTEDLWPILKEQWQAEAYNDYGAHYFFIRLFGIQKRWPTEAVPLLSEWLLEAVENQRPQFTKSKAAALLSLATVNPDLCKQHLWEWADAEQTQWWECRYASAMAFEKVHVTAPYDGPWWVDPHPFVKARWARHHTND